MAPRKLTFLLTLIVLTALLLHGCTARGELSLTNPRMALDETGLQTTTVYSPYSDLHAVADLYNAPSGTVVSADWYAVEADGYEPGSLLDGMTLTVEEESYTGRVSFQYKYDDPSGWPQGKYKVELYLNDEWMHTLNFEVK